MESVIAEKYAVALLRVAQEQKALEPVGAELRSVLDLVESNEALQATLGHPRIRSAEKMEALRAILGRKLSATLENFLTLLIMKKRIQHLRAVWEHYERLLFQVQGKAAARVLTPFPLTDPQRKALSDKLGGMFGLSIQLREEVRPGLIGGMVIYMGDQRMDASLLGQLERVKQRLLKVEIQ